MNDKTKKFLTDVKRSAAKDGGYVLSNPQVELSDSSNDGLSRDWQFRIAIDPDSANIQKAAEIVAEVFHKKNRDLQFKVFVPPPTNSDSIWDGTQKRSGDTDRDQRGKEVCVYMRYDERNGKYEISPDEWKELMLEAWSKLQKAGVNIGYLSPPYGDRAVPTSQGITSPFSYTAFKPYNNRNGILLERNYNPKGFPDPLHGIEISPADLKRHGIKPSTYENQQRRLLSQQIKHAESTEIRILKNLNGINSYKDELKDNLRQLQQQSERRFNFSSVHGKDDQLSIIKGLEEQLNTLAKAYPMESRSSLSENPQVTSLRRGLENFKLLVDQGKYNEEQLASFVEKFQQFKTYHEENYENNLDAILKDYRASSPAMLFLEKNGLRNNLADLVRADPQNMQILFRQITHLEREKQSIASAEKQFGVQAPAPQIHSTLSNLSPSEVTGIKSNIDDVSEEFNPNFYKRWERTLMEDEVLHQLLTDNNFNARVVQEQLNKREWLNRAGANLPSEMLIALAKSKLYFAQIIFENPAVTANLAASEIKGIHKLYSDQFNNGMLSIEKFAAIEKSMLNNSHFAISALQNPEMVNEISKQNFLYMLDAHKNNVDFCRELIANKDKLPERLSLHELKKDERFRAIVKASPNLPQNLGKSSVLQKINIIERVKQTNDTGYESPKQHRK